MLGKKRLEAIGALVNGATVETAAQAAGVHERTLYRWLGLEDFRAALEEKDREAFQAITAQLTAGTPAMLKVLEDIAQDPGQAANVRVRAAQGYITLALRYREARSLPEIEARLTELEKAHNEK